MQILFFKSSPISDGGNFLSEVNSLCKATKENIQVYPFILKHMQEINLAKGLFPFCTLVKLGQYGKCSKKFKQKKKKTQQKNVFRETRYPHTFNILSHMPTLKMRSRSLESNQLSRLSQWCIYAILAKIHSSVQETVCSQAGFFCVCFLLNSDNIWSNLT